MKINCLKFSNLASLAGTITIDFQAPEFQSHGLFLLSGPTGAGKSTVLDAVALALYGRTPRLSSGREIDTLLSQGQVEYFAEVEFCLGERVFQANWHRARAYGRVEGKLQDPRHTLLEFSATEGKFLPLAEQTEVARTIASLSGLNFERFTRTMLLAQGRFADFLLAGETKKSDLLEQITGTEIYSLISQKVYALTQEKTALRREKENLLRELQPNLGSEEERPRWLRRLREIQEILPKLLREQKKLQLQQQNCARAETLTREMAELERETQNLIEEEKSFEPQAERLRRGLSAEELQRDFFTRLQEQRRSRDELEKQCREIEQAQPGLIQNREDAAAQKNQAELALVQEKQAAAALQAILKQVRPLDAELRLLQNKRNETAVAEQQAAQTLAEAEKSWNENQEQLRSAQEDRARLSDWQKKHSDDSKLVRDLPELQNLHQNWQKAAQAARKMLAQSADAQKRSQAQERLVLQAQTQLQQTEQQRLQLAAVRQQAQEAHRQLLGDKTEENWRQQEMLLTQQTSSLTGALKTISELGRLENACASAQQRQAELAEKLRLSEEFLSLSRQNYECQQEHLSLARDIHNYAEMRRKLKSGQPCPLCGSSDHPFEKLPQPKIDEQERLLKSYQQTLEQAQQSQRQLLQQHSEISGKLEQSQEDFNARQKEWQIVRQKLPEAILPADLKSLAEIESCLILQADKLRMAQKQAGEHWQQLQQSRQRLEASEKDAQAAQEAFSRQQGEQQKLIAVAQLESQRAATEEENSSAAQEQEQRCQQDFSRLADSYRERQAGLLTEAQAICERLTQRLLVWKQNGDALAAAQLAEQNLQSAAAPLAAALQAARERLRQASNALDKVAEDCKIRENQRQELFAGRDCEQEEIAAAVRLEQAEAAGTAASAALAQAEEKLNTSQALLEQQRRQHQSYAATVEKEGAVARQALLAAGFRDEDDFRCACLPSQEKAFLQAQKEQLANNQAACRGRYEKTAAQQRELQELCQNLDCQAICQRLEIIDGEIASLHEESGRCDKQEETWQQVWRQTQGLAVELQRLRGVEGQWQELNQLIGSSEGAKFRTIAQSITLDNVIAQANEQLKIIMPRYELVRAGQEELENKNRKSATRCLTLNVIDDYLDGQERDTKNISGGETFVVSLALALGLSSLENTNLKVETLFLDEGFGSLDAIALEQALQALSKLHDEGRLIGIISHVEAMKDMEPQIAVKRLGNSGRSTISGPGCTYLPPQKKTRKTSRRKGQKGPATGQPIADSTQEETE